MSYYTWKDPFTEISYIVDDSTLVPDFFTEESDKWSAYQAWLADGNKPSVWK